ADGAVLSQSSVLPAIPVAWTLSPSGDRVAAISQSRLYVSKATEAPAKPVVRNSSGCHFTGIAFHPSGKYLAATSNDKTVQLYDTETWQVAKTYTWNIGRMCAIAFSPDGTLAAAGSRTGKVVVWDVDV